MDETVESGISSKVRLIDFEAHTDVRGNLVALENNKSVPFSIRRVYYIYGVSEGMHRGYHAHKNLEQLLICVSGSFKVSLDDGTEKKEFTLADPKKGLYIRPLIWNKMYDFSEDCVLLVLASNLYDESDYIRDYGEFLKAVKNADQMCDFFIHEKAIVETENIGHSTTIWAFSHVLPGATIGVNCNINDHTFIENDVVIGNNVTVKSGVYIWDGVTIEDNVFIGPNVTFTNDLMPRSKQYPDTFIKTHLEKFCSIGANATIVAGNTIGKYAMVGAGSVVTKNVPPYSLVYGNPATLKGYICEKGHKLHDYYCDKCRKDYRSTILKKEQ